MGLFSFLKEAGQKLFGKEVKAAEQAAAVDPAKKAEADPFPTPRQAGAKVVAEAR